MPSPLTEVAFLLVSIVMLCCSMVTRPNSATCQPRWHNMGIRSDGLFCCVHEPVGDPLYDGAAGYPDRSVRPPGAACSRIYCTAGKLPIVINQRVVGCQR